MSGARRGKMLVDTVLVHSDIPYMSGFKKGMKRDRKSIVTISPPKQKRLSANRNSAHESEKAS